MTITPWDVWRYGFWGGCALIFIVLVIGGFFWLTENLRNILQNRESKFFDERREWKYKEREYVRLLAEKDEKK